MQLFKLDLTKVKAIGHDGNVPLGTLQILLENEEGNLEIKSVPAPLQALEGIKLISKLAEGENVEVPIVPEPNPEELLDNITMIATDTLACGGSSNIKAIGYESSKKVLQIDFYSNTRYRYFDVPFTVFSKFFKSESVGKFLNREIKVYYECKRVY
ncbi:MAG: KTSC domain-containing protein [Crocosphaera sp.]|nr:KTSC domain-containing protein [Crocosphaera sp.]